jgi:hypothetical protein
MTRGRALPALALALLVAGCASFGQQTGSGSSTAPSSGAGSPSATAGPSGAGPATSTAPHEGDHATEDGGHAVPFPADTRADTGQASPGARGTITDVQVAHHDGYDRVVFSFSGPGTPGWTVRYVAAATGQASGQPIDIPGGAVLSVALTGVGNPTDTGIPEFRRGPVTGTHTDVVTEAYFDGTFEGVSQAFVGTTAVLPFRAFLLRNPTRVVVDVREH